VALGTPYYIGRSTAGSGTSQTITVSTATTAGDTIIVAHSSSSSTGATISAMSDSAGNTYTRIISAASTAVEFGDLWAALPQNNSGTTAALSTSATISITWSATSGEKLSVAIGVSGVATASAVDQAPAAAHGTSTSASVSTGALAQGGELAIGFLLNQDTAAPSSVAWTQLTQQQSSTSPYVTVCWEDPAGTTALTFTGSFASSLNWCAMVVTLVPAVLAQAPVMSASNFSGSATLGANTTAGNSMVVIASAYTSDNTQVMASDAPTVGGERATASALVASGQSPSGAGSGAVAAFCWLLTGIPGGQTAVAVAFSSGSAVGVWAAEVRGTIACDQSAAGNGNSTGPVASGATPALGRAGELVTGTGVGYAVDLVAPAGWTALENPDTFFAGGYQMSGASGATPGWSQSVSGAGGPWAAVTAAFYTPAALASGPETFISQYSGYF
jgi:hypothetical protein